MLGSTSRSGTTDLLHVVERVGRFGKDNRAGIERTLHRISALRNRVGDVVGLTCRVGRAVFGTVDILRDVIEAGESILLLGRPGVGKTTLLREAARVLADDLDKRVVVVDTSNEIAGDGDIPHPAIGRARRMQVPSPDDQHAVMIEAVENHMPEVIVIDEIGTQAEALAARTIAERGVQLIATAHGNTLENLLQNPTLSDLVGGIHAVTLSDEEARRRGSQKTVLERKAPPTFDVVVEIQDQDRLAVHHRVAEGIDRFLRGVRCARSSGCAATTARWRSARPSRCRAHAGERGAREPAPQTAPASVVAAAAVRRRRRRRPTPPSLRRTLRIFPFAVSRSKLERAIRDLHVPARIVHHLPETDVVVTVKAQERRQPKRLRDAQLRGVRLAVVKSNTVQQLEGFLRQEFGVEDFPEEHVGRARGGRARHRPGARRRPAVRALAPGRLRAPPAARAGRARRAALREQGRGAVPAHRHLPVVEARLRGPSRRRRRLSGRAAQGLRPDRRHDEVEPRALSELCSRPRCVPPCASTIPLAMASPRPRASGTRRRRLPEGAEDVRQVVGGDTGAGVGHRELDARRRQDAPRRSHGPRTAPA